MSGFSLGSLRFMMKSLFLLLPICLLCLASCDSSSSDAGGISGFLDSPVDPELQVYLNEFLVEADKRGVAINGDRMSRLVIEFGDIESDALGICSTGLLTNTITISNDATPDQYRWVVIHELGHCILRMEHRDNTLSLMNSTLRLGLLDSLDETAVFDEFFQEQFFEGY